MRRMVLGLKETFTKPSVRSYYTEQFTCRGWAFVRRMGSFHLEKMPALLRGKHGHEIRLESLPRSLVNQHRMHMLGYSAFFNLATQGTTQVKPSTLTLKRCAARINE